MALTLYRPPFYTDSTVVTLTANFQLIPFGNPKASIAIENESTTSDIFYSFDGTDVHGKITFFTATLTNRVTLKDLTRIFASENEARFNPDSIYLKGATGNEAFNLSAW